MSTSDPALEPEVITEARLLQAKGLHIGFSMKRSLKIGGEIHSYESSTSLTLVHPDGTPISVGAAKVAAYLHTPQLITKVCADLTVCGAMGGDELRATVAHTQQQFTRLIESFTGAKHGRDTDPADLHGVGAVAGANGDPVEPTPGDADGDAAGVSPGTGPGPGPVGGGRAGEVSGK